MSRPTDLTIILAAGHSSRLGHLAFDRPKTLLTLSGQSLLERLCRQFAGFTRQFVIVAGANQTAISDQIAEFGLPITVIGGDALTSLGNAASLRAGLDAALEHIETYCHIVEADVVLASPALAAYTAATSDSALCVPIRSPHDDRLYRKPDGTLGISKTPSETHEAIGKFLGVTRINANRARRLHARIPRDSTAPYTDALSEVLDTDFEPLSVDARNAMEIDTGEDYRAALMNPRLSRRVASPTPAESRPRLSFTGHLKRLVGVHDPFGARLTQRAGFDGLWLGSFQISLASGGRDDASYNPFQALRLAEQLHHGGSLLPVVIDIGNGFSDAAMQGEFMLRAKNAGVCALCVEDNDAGRVCSLFNAERRQLITPAQFAARIENLVADAAGDLLIIARTESLTLGHDPEVGIEDACQRLAVAADAGADALLPHYIGTNAEIARTVLAHGLPRPCLLVPTGLLDMPVKQFKEMGYAAVVYANLDLRLRFAQLQAMYASLNAHGALSNSELGDLADPQIMQLTLDE